MQPGAEFLRCNALQKEGKQSAVTGTLQVGPSYQGRGGHVALGAWRFPIHRPLSRALSVVTSFMMCSKSDVIDGAQCRLVQEYPVAYNLVVWYCHFCCGYTLDNQDSTACKENDFSLCYQKQTGPGAQPAGKSCSSPGNKAPGEGNVYHSHASMVPLEFEDPLLFCMSRSRPPLGKEGYSALDI